MTDQTMPLAPELDTSVDGKTVNPAPDEDLTHTWIASATIPVSEKHAKMADMRTYLRLKEVRIDVLEVYCSTCRRQYEDVVGDDCQGKINNEHLIGGDQRERVKRKGLRLPPGVQVTVIPGPRINRMGIDGVLRGEA